MEESELVSEKKLYQNFQQQHIVFVISDISREISIVLYNGSNYDFRLKINNLTKIFCSSDFECLL